MKKSKKIEASFEFIKSVHCVQSGGNVMLDIIELKDGKVLVISDEIVCKYKSLDAFYAGQCVYNHDCISLLDG